MAADKPLNVRCAEALGWRDVRHAKSGWIGVAPGVPICSEPISPYGADTPEGWACTGPLMDRFDLHTESLHQNGLIYAWRERQGDEPGICGPNAPHRCAAIAEWVAQYGKKVANVR